MGLSHTIIQGSLTNLRDQREVHVWFVEFAASNASVEACFRSLSPDEVERASRFRFEHLKTAFTLSRGILRFLLGRYLAIEPGHIRLAYGARGKPRLAHPESPLEFNLAHSGKLLACAFAVGCELGVDIEEIRPLPDQESIVHRFFSAEECAEWLELDRSQRDEAFFRCWTRKEAYIKALGDGLSIPLNSFRVSLRPEEPASLIHATGIHATGIPAAGDAVAVTQWSLCSLTPADGYAGSLAFPERARGVRIMPRLSADAVLELVRDSAPFPPAAKGSAKFRETRLG